MNRDDLFTVLDIAWACWGGGEGRWRKDFAEEIAAQPWTFILPKKQIAEWALEWAQAGCRSYLPEHFDKSGKCWSCGEYNSEHN